MKTIVTLKRFYFKEVEIEIDNELLRGMDCEQISTFLTEEHYIVKEDSLFEDANLEELEINSKGEIYEDTDRYDIYDGDEQVYGGHL
jgi:hypothetical protein